MPRATGPGVKGRPGLRKKSRPATWVPARKPGRKPARPTSTQPRRCLRPPLTAHPAPAAARRGSPRRRLEDEERAVDLVVEVPLIGVARELDRHGVARLELHPVADPLDLDVLLVE